MFLSIIGLYYSFFQDQKIPDVDKNHHEPTKHLQSTITSKTESDFPQLKQDDNSLKAGKPDGLKNPMAANKDDKDRQDDDIYQISTSHENHRPEQAPTEAVSNQLIHLSSKASGLEKTEINIQKESVIDNSDHENDPPERNDPNRVDKVKVKRARRQSDLSFASQSLKSVEVNKSDNYQTHFENNIKVIKATACRNIKNHNPLDSGDSFKWSMDRIYIWSSLECERPPSSIRHIYYFKGEKVADILLEVHSSNWRTWSYKTILNKRYIGQWRVDITGVDGKLLQSINFEIRDDG